MLLLVNAMQMFFIFMKELKLSILGGPTKS